MKVQKKIKLDEQQEQSINLEHLNRSSSQSFEQHQDTDSGDISIILSQHGLENSKWITLFQNEQIRFEDDIVALGPDSLSVCEKLAAYANDESEYNAIRRVLRIPEDCLLYTSPSPRDATLSRMPSSA